MKVDILQPLRCRAFLPKNLGASFIRSTDPTAVSFFTVCADRDRTKCGKIKKISVAADLFLMDNYCLVHDACNLHSIQAFFTLFFFVCYLVTLTDFIDT